MTSRTVNKFCIVLVNPFRKLLRILILALVVAASHFSMANDFQEDLRLFFPSIEYSESKNIMPANKQLEKKINTIDTDEVVDRSMIKRSFPNIWFTAVVRNGKSIQLLVNDLPCQKVLDDSLSQMEKIVGVKCRHLNQKQYLLSHRTDNHALLIYKDGKYIATLFVGQSL